MADAAADAPPPQAIRLGTVVAVDYEAVHVETEDGVTKLYRSPRLAEAFPVGCAVVLRMTLSPAAQLL